MQTVLEKEKVPLFHYLTDALLSTSQYENTVRRALAMPDCTVVPFFGFFMREIRKIMKDTPSTIVLSDQDGKTLSEVRPKSDVHSSRHSFDSCGGAAFAIKLLFNKFLFDSIIWTPALLTPRPTIRSIDKNRCIHSRSRS